ncbi:hypothetical protein HLI03_32155 [Rhizobium laguerreae]|uniref:DUF7940 domain-containing protein n=1 Tax=Rhizobium laguerreae TaxID=1076926 RepID=UPI001389EE36|nr:hypothetical protein [Rhizobium laguerreae]NDK54034.1 hypothetical protein [Rhizobium laguerreae]NNH46242.1 hypothetical protein [Rhizobium laguerreae]
MLVHNWRCVLARSLSLWCVYFAGTFELAPYIVPYLDSYIPPWLSIALLLLSIPARVIDQRLSNGK